MNKSVWHIEPPNGRFTQLARTAACMPQQKNFADPTRLPLYKIAGSGFDFGCESRKQTLAYIQLISDESPSHRDLAVYIVWVCS
jgi:hypothetical protein